MALNDELRQRLVLVLQKQGTEAIDEVKGLMRELQGEFMKAGEALRDAFLRGEGDILEFNRATKELTQSYMELGKIVAATQKQEEEAALAAGKAMRDRIDAMARAERMGEELARQQAEADGEEKRRRIEMMALFERLDERDAAEKKRLALESAQAQIEAYERVERVAKLAADADIARRRAQNGQNGVVRETQFYVDVLADAYDAELKQATATNVLTKSKEQLGHEADRTNRIMRNMSYTILSAGHAFQDAAQGGFGAVLNNIPLLTSGFTQIAADIGNFSESTKEKMMMWAPAIAGTMTIVATAAYTLYQNWDKVERLFQGGIPRPVLDDTAELERKLKEARDRTEELGKLTSMTAREIGEYKQASEAVKELNEQLKKEKELKDLLGGQSQEERERASGFKEAVARGGGSLAMEELRDALSRDADASGKVFNPVKNGLTTAEQAAKDLFVEGGRGDKNAIDAIQKALDQAFGTRSSFGGDVRGLSPEGKALAKQGQEHVEMLNKMAEEMEKADKKLGDEEERSLTAESKRNEKEFDVKRKQTEDYAKDEQKVAEASDKARQNAAKAQNKVLNDRLDDAGKAKEAVDKQRQLGQFANRFRAAGFADNFAEEGARDTMSKIKGGDNPQAAMNAVYRQLIKNAATQEQAVGMMGQATAIMLELQRRDQMTRMQLQRLQGKVAGARNRKPSLLPTIPGGR